MADYPDNYSTYRARSPHQRIAAAQFSRPADNTAYAAGDHIANSTTAAQVTGLEFAMPSVSGRVLGAKVVVVPGSGNVVITNFAFDLLLFNAAPFAAGAFPADNAALNVTGALMRTLIGVVTFSAAAWRQPTGALTAGAAAWQRVNLSSFCPYFLTGATPKLYGLLQAQGAWTPTGIVNTFDVELEIRAD